MSEADRASRALATAIERAYDAFARYDVGAIAAGSRSHTRFEELVAALHARERRSIPAAAIATFFEDFGGTIDADEATFKALLPRLLELAVPGTEEIAHFSVARIGDRLAAANRASWPTHESDAVDRWAHAWFEATLATADPHGTVLEDVLCALGSTYGDLALFLTALRDATDGRTRRQSAHLVLTVAFAVARARAPVPPDWSCVGSYWQKGSRAERQMLTWLATHASHARLIADATVGGCACDWVRATTAEDIALAFAAFASELTETILA